MAPCVRPQDQVRKGPPCMTYQSSLLHALHHHEEDLLCLTAAVVEGLLDGDQQLIFDTVTHQPVQDNHQTVM